MSESKSLVWKRNLGEIEFQGSTIKRIKLDEADSKEKTISSSSSSCSRDSGTFFFSEETDHRSSSIISSGCSSSETNEIATNTRLPFLDLEDHETEISTLINNNLRDQRNDMDSAKKKKTEKRKDEEKAPTQAEIDEFFAAAERYEQKRFTEKYNYDIVNDTPLEGRYEWISLKP